MNKSLVSVVREKTRLEIGSVFDERVFQLALRKAKLWMRDAYGGIDWQAFVDEGGGSIAFYYLECAARPDGIDTENRRRAVSRRESGK